ncbi:MAG: vitamin K epoxide reductase family protein [Gemmatimonadetes bacterium]|nr:vitamin K epoxide reductase family protein [Gemmatimonadota bacterium]
MTEVDEVVPGAPLNRMLVSVLSLIGFFVALYLWAHNAGLTGPIICGVGDCATVQSSEYARIGGVPVSAIGVAGYVALFVLSMMGLQPGRRSSRAIAALLLSGSTFGVAFSAYLTYLEAAVIQAWCQYCVASAIIITLIFFATLPEIPRLRSPEGAA